MAVDEFVKGMAIGMLRCGKKAKFVSQELGISCAIVFRWWHRWQSEGSLKRRKGSGRPRKTKIRADSKLVLAAKRNRFDSVPRLAISWMSAAGVRCSIRTAYRRLAEAGIKSYRPAVRIPLSKFLTIAFIPFDNITIRNFISGHHHKRNRVIWCKDRINWSRQQWRKVLWTDESRFTLDFHDGRIKVHRLPGERYADCCIREHDRYGGGSVLIWAGIWHGGRTIAVRINGTVTGQSYLRILTSLVIPTVQEHGLVFQDDNATPHRAAIVRQAVLDSGVNTLPWPARSPDLSPIEHAWDALGRKVRESYEHSPTTLDELAERLIHQWSNIEQTTLDLLCDSMPKRLRACIKAHGGHTRY